MQLSYTILSSHIVNKINKYNMTAKIAGKYSFVKIPIQKSQLEDRYNAKDKQTNEIWMARVIHRKVAQKYKIQTHIEYNQQTLDNLKTKSNVIYVKEIFYKDNQIFIIQEKYQKRLSDYLQEKGTLKADQVEVILQNIFMGVCDIYEEGYIHRNIRPEHVVFVQGDSQQENLWKIQTLVYDNEEYDDESPYVWKKSTASPEQKSKKSELDDQKLDSQLVWNFGYLAVQLLMGDQFMRKKLVKDKDILWNKIQQKCDKNPNLYCLIQNSFRLDFKDRISLNDFLNLQIFQECGRFAINQYFLTASNIFKTKTLSSFQSKIQIKNRNMLSINYKNMSPKQHLSSSIQQEQENQAEEDNVEYIKASFLAQVSKQYILIPAITKLVQYYFKKMAILAIEKSKEKRCLALRDQFQKRLITLSTQFKNSRPNSSDLINQFYVISASKQVQYWKNAFNQLCGYCYSRLREECEKSTDKKALRAMSYFVIVAYMINSSNWSALKQEFPDLKNEKALQRLNFTDQFNAMNIDKLVKISQDLAIKYFKLIK